MLDKRREALRLYREILRTTRQFQWTNEAGEKWCVLNHSIASSVARVVAEKHHEN
jgi:hypothetical protein